MLIFLVFTSVMSNVMIPITGTTRLLHIHRPTVLKVSVCWAGGGKQQDAASQQEYARAARVRRFHHRLRTAISK